MATDLRGELHSVDLRLTALETVVRLDGLRRDEQHDAVIEAFGAIKAEVKGLRADLSDQGKTPGPPPSLPPGPPPSLPPGPALPTLAPEVERERSPRRDESSDPGAITISPKRLAPWLAALIPLLARAWPVLASAALTGGGVEACHQLELHAPSAEPTSGGAP